MTTRQIALAVVAPFLLVLNAGTVPRAAEALVAPRSGKPGPLARDEFRGVAMRPVDSLQHLLSGERSGFAYGLRAVVKDSASFRELWARAVSGQMPPPPMPQIDFDRDMVIVAAMGGQRSTGFDIRIDSVVARGRSTEVHVLLRSPGTLCIEGAAMTNPVDIVKVSRTDGVAVFRDRHVEFHCKLP